jgi:hypothetical protein
MSGPRWDGKDGRAYEEHDDRLPCQDLECTGCEGGAERAPDDAEQTEGSDLGDPERCPKPLYLLGPDPLDHLPHEQRDEHAEPELLDNLPVPLPRPPTRPAFQSSTCSR